LTVPWNIYQTQVPRIVNNYEEFVIKDSHKHELNELLDFVIKKLEENNVQYWIIGGTLLGAIRHGDIIPWDGDADIGIMDKDYKKVQALFKNSTFKNQKFNKYFKDYGINGTGNLLPILKNVVQKSNVLQIAYGNLSGNVDIFPFRFFDNKYQYKGKMMRDLYPKEYFEEDELFPLKLHKFGNRQLYIPQKPCKHLDRAYNGWERYAVIDTLHIPGKSRKYKYFFKKPYNKDAIC